MKSRKKRIEAIARLPSETIIDIIDTIPSGIFIYEFNGKNGLHLVYANKNAEMMTGVSLLNSAGKEFDEIWPSSKKEGLKKVFLSPFFTGKPFSSDRIDYKDNNIDGVFKVRSFILPAKFLVIAFEDETSSIKAEDNLKDSMLQLESIFRVAPTGIGVVKDRVILTLNQKVCDISGYSREELIGKQSRLLYPSDEEFLRVGKEKYAQIKKTGTGVIETVWIRKDGRQINVLINSTLIDKKNISRGTTFTVLDITDRKMVENELRLSEMKYRKLVESAHDAIIVSDAKNGIITDANEAACKLLGMKKSEIIGMKQSDMYPEDEKRRYKKIFRQFVDDGTKIGPIVSKVVNKNIGLIDVEINASITEVDGKKMLQGTFRDISRRIEAENKLKNYAEGLERMVAERTAEIESKNEELKRQVNELEKFHKFVVGRELVQIQLKKRIAELEEERVRLKQRLKSKSAK